MNIPEKEEPVGSLLELSYQKEKSYWIGCCVMSKKSKGRAVTKTSF